MTRGDLTIRQILQRAETLYEQFGNPLVGSPRRRAWAFARAFGATRLAHEFGVPRATVVLARRRAFARWRYWLARYEESRWQELVELMGKRHHWERYVVRYLRLRATLRQGQFPSAQTEWPVDALAACALRSLASVPWQPHPTACWQSVWCLLAHRQCQHARVMADQLGWSAVHWRRARHAVTRLHALVWLPLSQRQLLALSAWPAAHLAALQQTGQALFPHQHIRLLDLAGLSSTQILRVARPRARQCAQATGMRGETRRLVDTGPVPWRRLCQLLQSHRRATAYVYAQSNGWSDRHVRRLQCITRQLTSLVQLPLSLRQCLALSQWPTSHLQELRVAGATVIDTHRWTTAALVRLSPRTLHSIAARLSLPEEEFP